MLRESFVGVAILTRWGNYLRNTVYTQKQKWADSNEEGIGSFDMKALFQLYA